MSMLMYGWLPVQAVEARTTEVCGVDMSAINRYRWTPAFAAGVLATDVLACMAFMLGTLQSSKSPEVRAD